MRVLIDAHMVGGHETGNETYIVNLIDGLSRISNITLGIVITPGAKLPKKMEKLAADFIVLPSENNWSRLLYDLPSICKKWRADLLHTTYIGPWFIDCPLIVSVHDVTFKRYPEYFSLRDRLLFATLLPLTLRKAKQIITISKDAEKEIKKFFPYTKEKLDITSLAANDDFHVNTQNNSTAIFLERYNISGQFILAAGNLQPRKNLLRLIEAFAKVKKKWADGKLVIVGKAQWQSSKIFALVDSLGLQNEVIFTGYVSDDDLVTFYNLAEVFIYPSLYEGFGLPILEAMACGTPVITSNISSMPDVAGDAAIQIDPYNVDQIAEAIQNILSDIDMPQNLSTMGLERTKLFSWEKTAQQTVEIYKKALGIKAQI